MKLFRRLIIKTRTSYIAFGIWKFKINLLTEWIMFRAQNLGYRLCNLGEVFGNQRSFGTSVKLCNINRKIIQVILIVVDNLGCFEVVWG